LHILITNDDGVHADGLWVLAKKLKEIANVTVVAPDRDQSGTGTAVTLRHPLRLSEVKSSIENVRAFSVEGTPGDSVILALRYALKEKIDLVVSGINEGPNLGNDVYISGTVGGALQGFFYGIPALAISVAAFEDLLFDAAADIAKLIASGFLKKSLPEKLLLNVNLPNLPKEQIRGLEITRLGERNYTDSIDQRHDGKRKYYWIVRGEPRWDVREGTDIWAVKGGKVSCKYGKD